MGGAGVGGAGGVVDFMSAGILYLIQYLQDVIITLGVQSQVYPNYPENTFPISLQHPKENMKDDVDCLLADKH